jgi:predicted dehydrogenase
MSMDSIRLAVVGYGLRGRSMLALATQAIPDIRPVGICDICPERIELASSEYPQAQVFADYTEMLDGVQPDALLVETPATLHAQFCLAALDRGIHVMGDVPAVESIEQAYVLWEAQQRSQAFYTIGANPNLWAFVETAVDLKQKGLLGEPYLLEAEYVHDIRELFKVTPWRRTYESIRYCTHSLGPLLRLIGEDLVSVSCFDTGSHIEREAGQHDAMVALFSTPSNVVVRVLTTFITNFPTWGHRYRVYGTKGYFERTPAYEGDGTAKTYFYSTDLYADRRLVELPVHELRPEYAKEAHAATHGGADYALLVRFFDAVRSGGPAPVGLREALRMTLPGLFALESARRGGELTAIRYPWS